VRAEVNGEVARFVEPAHLHSRDEVLAVPSPVPAQAGVYGWWFRGLPWPGIDTAGCRRRQEHTLLYVGISPERPPANGRAASKRTLRMRIRQHYTRTAAASTLRRSLGCLLAEQLGIGLQLAGPSGRTNFGAGEHLLSEWMAANAYVSWIVRDHPWELEDELIGSHPVLTQARARCLAQARAHGAIRWP
jgi:GIY-YIG catalytic domain